MFAHVSAGKACDRGQLINGSNPADLRPGMLQGLQLQLARLARGVKSSLSSVIKFLPK